MNLAAQQELWQDPRRWFATRRAKALKVLSAVLLIGSTFGLVPSVWVLAMPNDPTLRPDIMHTPAVAGLTFCVALLFLGRRISRTTRDRYGRDLYSCIAHAKQAGARAGVVFDVEMPQLFPRVMFARRDRIMALAFPYPMLIPIDDVRQVTLTADGFVRLDMKDERKHPFHLLAGDGISPQSIDETRYQMDRLREFVFMPHNTRTEEDVQQEALAAAFLANPRLR